MIRKQGAVSWWNSEFANLRKKVRSLIKWVKLTKNLDNYHRELTRYNFAIRKAKRLHWKTLAAIWKVSAKPPGFTRFYPRINPPSEAWSCDSTWIQGRCSSLWYEHSFQEASSSICNMSKMTKSCGTHQQHMLEGFELYCDTQLREMVCQFAQPVQVTWAWWLQTHLSSSVY